MIRPDLSTLTSNAGELNPPCNPQTGKQKRIEVSNQPFTTITQGYAVLDKTVGTSTKGNSAYLYLPKAFAGHQVRIILMESIKED
jgi:putative transposon-encoded protein